MNLSGTPAEEEAGVPELYHPAIEFRCMAAGVKSLDFNSTAYPLPAGQSLFTIQICAAAVALPRKSLFGRRDVSANRCAQASHKPGRRRNLPKQRGQYHLVYTYAPP